MRPITPLPNETYQVSKDAAGSYLIKKEKTKQVKPYNVPAPWKHTRQLTLTVTPDKKWGAPSFGGMANAAAFTNPTNKNTMQYVLWPTCYAADLPMVQQVLNYARSKFVSKLGDKAENLVNLAERRQAAEMMGNTILRLARFGKFIYERDYYRAARTLNIYISRKKSKLLKKTCKTVGDGWLEFHFGWEPLVNDIGTTIELLSSVYPPDIIQAKHTLRDKPIRSFGSPSGGNTYCWSRRSDVFRCIVSAQVKITNPNLNLAGQMGFVNPTSVIWELVPFSFLVDWFYNVGDYLNQWSDFVGIEFIEPYYTVTTKSEVYSQTTRYFNGLPNGSFSMSASAMGACRTLGIPSVTLRKRQAKALSVSRGATAIALLLQFM